MEDRNNNMSIGNGAGIPPLRRHIVPPTQPPQAMINRDLQVPVGILGTCLLRVKPTPSRYAVSPRLVLEAELEIQRVGIGRQTLLISPPIGGRVQEEEVAQPVTHRNLAVG